MIYPWMETHWQRLVSQSGRLPHALLFSGPSGVGKRALADALAARLLCGEPASDGHACGRCSGCLLRLSGNHPDHQLLMPASEISSDESETQDKPAKAAATQIVIDQVRALQQRLMVTGHQGGSRVVLVEPAEAMNLFTANALLKLLEEPPQDCHFVLVTSAPRRLLPTIRSRCQIFQFNRPDPTLASQLVGEAEAALLALCGGMPLAAHRLAAQGGMTLHRRFVSEIERLPDANALALAGQWEAWLKSKEALAAGFGIVQLADWMLRWCSDLASVKLGGRARFFPLQRTELERLAGRLSVARAVNCYNDGIRLQRVVRHPLNARLLLEDMLLRYSRAFSQP